jgi:hypothetical protein
MEPVNNIPFALELLPNDIKNSIPFELDSLFVMQRVSKAWKKIAEEQMMTWHERQKQQCFSLFNLKNERMLRIVQQNGTRLRALRISHWNDSFTPQYVRICTNLNALYIGHLKTHQALSAIVECVNFTSLTALSIPNDVSSQVTHASLRKLCLVRNNSPQLDTSLIQQSASSLLTLKIHLLTLTIENTPHLLNLNALTSLNLKFSTIDDPDSLFGILTTLTALRALRFPSIMWKKEYTRALTQHLTKLRKLDLNVNVPGNYGVMDMARSLTQLTSFTAIDFSSVTTSDDGVSAIFQNLTRLEQLNLSRNLVKDGVFQHLPRLSSLRSLIWDEAYLTAPKVAAIGKLRFLNVLIIPRVIVNDVDIEQLLYLLPPLKKLDISFLELGKFLINQIGLCQHSLEWLCAGCQTTGDNELKAVTSVLINLTSLTIGGNFSSACITDTIAIFKSKRRDITIISLESQTQPFNP